MVWLSEYSFVSWLYLIVLPTMGDGHIFLRADLPFQPEEAHGSGDVEEEADGKDPAAGPILHLVEPLVQGHRCRRADEAAYTG